MADELQLQSTHIAGVFEQRIGSPSLENPAFNLNDPVLWETVFGDSVGTDAGINITHEKALMCAAWWQATWMIGGDIAKLPLDIYRRRDDIRPGARTDDSSHPAWNLVRNQPNEEMNAFQFWNRVMTWALNWGTAYVYIDQDSQGTPLALLPLLPDRTYPARMNGRLWIMTDVSGYSTPVMLPVNRVLRIEGLNTDNVEAVDTMRQARNSLALSLANEKFASKFFKHGGRVGGILELPTAVDKVARDKIEEGFRKTYEGADNPFKTVVLRDNAKFHAAQTSPRDSQMIEANESQVRQVARWFNLSPSKLGLSDSVSYNSKAEDNQAYLSSTLERWLVQIAQECNAKLLRPEEKATHFFEHNTRALLRMNPKDEAEVLRTYREIGVLSSNEVRQVLNLLPRDGGDSYENPNTTSGASATTKETPAEAIDAKDMPTPNPQRAKILAVLGAKARDKAKRSTAMVEWVDSGFARDKAAWQKEYGEQPPADVVEEIRTKLAKILETTHESQLWVKVDELFKNLEK